MKRILSACVASMLLGTTIPAMAHPETNESPNQAQANQPPSGGQSQSQSGQPGMVTGEAATMKATITDINKTSRMVTLKDEDGNTMSVRVPRSAPNFDKLQKGDVVTASFYRSEAVMLAKPGEEPTGAEQMQYMVRPENGQPGGMMVNSVRTQATIEDINPQTRDVTLKGADGKTVKLKVDKSVQNLDRLKKGDQIVVRYTEAAAISVEKPQQQQQ